MNRAEALRSTGAFTVPAVLVIGGSMLTLSLISVGNYRTEAAPPRPGPTVTATAPAPATESPHRTPPQQTAPPITVVAASQPRGSSGGGGGMSSRARPGTVAPSGPRPAPKPPATSCSGNVLTVQALRAACVTIGGTR